AALPPGLRQFRPEEGRSLRRAKSTKTPRRPGHCSQPAQNRRVDSERQSIPECAEGIRQLRRIHLAVRGRRSETKREAFSPANPRAHKRIRRVEQRLARARIQVRWLDDLLFLDAGRRHCQRPHRRLLSPRATSVKGKALIGATITQSLRDGSKKRCARAPTGRSADTFA